MNPVTALKVVDLRAEAAALAASNTTLQAALQQRDEEGQQAVSALAGKCDVLTTQWEGLLAQRDAAAIASSKENATLQQKVAQLEHAASTAATSAASSAQLHAQLNEKAQTAAATADDLQNTVAMLTSSLEQSEARASALEGRFEVELQSADAKRAAAAAQLDQQRGQLETLKLRVLEERQQRDTVAAEAAIHLAELRGKRDQVAKQVQRITELQRNVDDATVELQSKEGHTEVIKAQMSEITRLRSESRSLAAATADFESAQAANNATCKQQLAAQLAQHGAAIAGLQADLISANTRAEHAEAERTRNGDARLKADAAAATANNEHARQVQMLKQEVSDFQSRLNEETGGNTRAAAEYHAELMQLNNSMAEVTSDNTRLHDQVLQASEQRMSLVLEHEETIKLMQHQTAQTNRDNAQAASMHGARFHHGFCCVRVSTFVDQVVCTVRVSTMDSAVLGLAPL
jgi:chromosome segregation ATPase